MNDYMKDHNLLETLTKDASEGRSLFERLKGRATLDTVHKIFYDKIYAHPWLKQFFSSIEQKHIEAQQSDFIAQLIGGPKKFSGRMPKDAHMHIMINEEIFAVRHELLAESLSEAGILDPELSEWLRLDLAFKKVLIKQSPKDCQKRFFSDEIVIILPPLAKAS
ncbi:MAG: group 1 truncated hemoglobin [Proteobacteria bacterium]|nr:group 1 truncated hemoglobin [Pseudomonadota bacterium]